jgi:hypothetical protein
MTMNGDSSSLNVAELVKLGFRIEREGTFLGRSLNQVTSENDSVSTTFDWMNDAERTDFIRFVMAELRMAYECIVVLASEVVKLQGPTV